MISNVTENLVENGRTIQKQLKLAKALSDEIKEAMVSFKKKVRRGRTLTIKMKEKLADPEFPGISKEDKITLGQELAFLKLRNGVNFAKRVRRVSLAIGEKQLEKRDWSDHEAEKNELKNQMKLIEDKFDEI